MQDVGVKSRFRHWLIIYIYIKQNASISDIRNGRTLHPRLRVHHRRDGFSGVMDLTGLWHIKSHWTYKTLEHPPAERISITSCALPRGVGSTLGFPSCLPGWLACSRDTGHPGGLQRQRALCGGSAAEGEPCSPKINHKGCEGVRMKVSDRCPENLLSPRNDYNVNQ